MNDVEVESDLKQKSFLLCVRRSNKILVSVCVRLYDIRTRLSDCDEYDVNLSASMEIDKRTDMKKRHHLCSEAIKFLPEVHGFLSVCVYRCVCFVHSFKMLLRAFCVSSYSEQLICCCCSNSLIVRIWS